MENGRKVPSSINGEQIFNIFKDKPFGSILGRRAFEESNDFKKERASLACKPSLPARYRNVLTRESACPKVDSRQVGGFGFGDVLAIPLILLNIVDRAVAAVCEFVDLAVTFADHAAKFKALAETADTAEKSKKVMGSFTGFSPSGYKNIALRMGGDEKGFRDFPDKCRCGITTAMLAGTVHGVRPIGRTFCHRPK